MSDPISSVAADAATRERWTSSLAVYVGTAGAAVGLGSIWRFPYLAGTSGGSAFILVFVVATVLIACPLLVAELAIGRSSRRSPPEAAGAVAVASGLSSRWNAIGVLGSGAGFLVFSYYSVIAGWVLAYAWKCASGVLTLGGPQRINAVWIGFRSNPLEVSAWHGAFVLLVVVISARGLKRGIEIANSIRGPGLLILLLGLVAYALSTGDVRRGFEFAFYPKFSTITPHVVLAAIGQAFYATGVGQALMIAYGAYAQPGASLVRASVAISASILVVSLLATALVFPLTFGYGMNPAQGPELVFNVLPRAFAEMPGGRVVGTLFFILLVLAALMPSVALLEPTVAWLMERFGWERVRAVLCAAASAWVLGLGSVLSFNALSTWYPLAALPMFRDKTFFDVIDAVSANVMMPIGAIFTSVLVGWRLKRKFVEEELAETSQGARSAVAWLLRYLCPLAIFAVLIASWLT